jgi:threonine dehydratase
VHNPAALSAIFVPIGGGGLIAGVAAYVKWIRPDVKIIGVEPTGACLPDATVCVPVYAAEYL